MTGFLVTELPADHPAMKLRAAVDRACEDAARAGVGFDIAVAVLAQILAPYVVAADGQTYERMRLLVETIGAAAGLYAATKDLSLAECGMPDGMEPAGRVH